MERRHKKEPQAGYGLGVVRAPARFNRARPLVQLSGRKRRNATITGTSYPSGEGPSYCELLTLSARALDAVDRDVRSVKSDGAYL
jgi:hypothetical protein